jgi:hypothetical protein
VSCLPDRGVIHLEIAGDGAHYDSPDFKLTRIWIGTPKLRHTLGVVLH